MDTLKLYEEKLVLVFALCAVVFLIGFWLVQTYIGLHAKVVEDIIVSTVVVLLVGMRLKKEVVSLYRELQPKRAK